MDKIKFEKILFDYAKSQSKSNDIKYIDGFYDGSLFMLNKFNDLLSIVNNKEDVLKCLKILKDIEDTDLFLKKIKKNESS